MRSSAVQIDDTQPRKRVQRVPYALAVQLVGERALAAECPNRRTLDYTWRPVGVPPERLCWLLIRQRTAKATKTDHDPPVIDTVRMIADRTNRTGVDWDYLTQTVDRLWRDIKRAKSR